LGENLTGSQPSITVVLWEIGGFRMSPIPIVGNSKLQNFGASKEVRRKFSKELGISTCSTTLSVPWGVI
jgi:hypothetical protein